VGILPEAGYLNEAINTQENKNYVYAAGGSTNLNSYDELLRFQKANSVKFPLATKDELGFRHPNDFRNVFTFIGKNNRIVGTLEEGTSLEEIDKMIKRAMASFHGIYLVKEKEKVLLTDNSTWIDLRKYFFADDYAKIEFIISNSTNPSSVQAEISGSLLNLNKTAFAGYSELNILAKLKGKEVYVQADFTVINPSEVYEDFEIDDLESSELEWVNSGKVPWFVTEDESFLNSKCIRSGQMYPGFTSGISLELDLSEPGTLIFAYKTATRSWFDMFHFYIDGLDISETESPYLWSGTNDWRLMSFSVRAGIRNIKWEYVRSEYVSYERDVVWLDMIVIPDKFNKNTSDVNNGSKVSMNAFPNPFNPVTQISFEMLTNEKAALMVFDVKGRLVAELYDGELTKGAHSFSFDGSGLSSGLYFSVLRYGDNVLTNKLILSK
jgi:hypothetical protein